MSLPAAVIFDLDGVLVTTDHYHFRGWKRLADELGMAFSQEDNHHLRGVSRAESLKTIYRLNNRRLPSEREFENQMACKNDYYVELVRQMTPSDVLPGSLAVLESLHLAGVKCAIASSSRNAGVVVERTGLGPCLDAIADGNDITRSKPDPEVFLVAASKLAIAPRACIGVEDAAAGVTAIRRAGMLAVGVGEQARAADLVVASIAELTLAAIERLFCQGR